MYSPDHFEAELPPNVLEPLLSTFQYWLSRARSLLEHETIEFLDQQQQLELLRQVRQALPTVTAAHCLFRATSGEIGIDLKLLEAWHHLVSECWQIISRYRQDQQTAHPEIS